MDNLKQALSDKGETPTKQLKQEFGLIHKLIQRATWARIILPNKIILMALVMMEKHLVDRIHKGGGLGWGWARGLTTGPTV